MTKNLKKSTEKFAFFEQILRCAQDDTVFCNTPLQWGVITRRFGALYTGAWNARPFGHSQDTQVLQKDFQPDQDQDHTAGYLCAALPAGAEAVPDGNAA